MCQKHRSLQQCLLVLQARHRPRQVSVSTLTRWFRNVRSVAKCSRVCPTSGCTASSYMGYLHCPYCGKTYTSIGNLRVHFIDAHLNYGPFPCAMCDKVSRTRSGLRMHIQRHHRNRVN
ncbi:Zinc finger protein 536 [Portunus trituberculatus]|uniref:Zinc finger protein 536 n=1 Tax=Portunus trituberculatus TaxID=210409 RepID=A0A5B7E9T7_PORTR|nr:Zinc finger protein 536 [Portunus trituberculatus]